MKNLNLLVTFRTKEELLNYFDLIGQSITEEEIENLKKRYEEAEAKDGTLSLDQLDNVSGGKATFHAIEVTGLNYTKILEKVKKITGSNKCFTAIKSSLICKFTEDKEEKSFVFVADSNNTERLGKIDFSLHMLNRPTEIFNNLTLDQLSLNHLIMRGPDEYQPHKQAFFGLMHWLNEGSEKIEWKELPKDATCVTTEDKQGIDALNDFVKITRACSHKVKNGII